jgi:hypothetical protein
MFGVFRTAAQIAPSVTLEGYAQGAGCALACDFSSSDEFEAALIAERRAEGRYGPRRYRARMLACALAAALALAIVAALVT